MLLFMSLNVQPGRAGPVRCWLESGRCSSRCHKREPEGPAAGRPEQGRRPGGGRQARLSRTLERAERRRGRNGTVRWPGFVGQPLKTLDPAASDRCFWGRWRSWASFRPPKWSRGVALGATLTEQESDINTLRLIFMRSTRPPVIPMKTKLYSAADVDLLWN